MLPVFAYPRLESLFSQKAPRTHLGIPFSHQCAIYEKAPAQKKIEVISTFKSKYARNLEGFFHRIWKHHKINGEWFYLIENERPDFMSLCEKLHNNLKILNEFQNK